jgi:hypothetical protein
MPAAISPTMIAATTKSTTMQNVGHQGAFATKWVRCCQRSLSPCPASLEEALKEAPVVRHAA